MISSKRILILPIVGIFCQMGLSLTIATYYPKLKESQTLSPTSEAFRQAVNKAMKAAQLAQSAKSRDEWNSVAISWQEAIDLMKAVPKSSSNYSVAREKVPQYQRNLQYALSKIPNRSPIPPVFTNLWSFGATKEEVIQAQGTPTGITRYDSLCKELLYYENSTIELKNGIVVEYDNLDNNLKVSVNTPVNRQLQGNPNFWTLGSTKEDVFKVQGTPERVTLSEASAEEILYYGNSTVALKNGLVTGYNNLDATLRVTVSPPARAVLKNTSTFWAVGSQREDVFKIQGTPTQVIQYDSLCKEVVYYGNSTVELKNSVVEGYYNFDNNLKVLSKAVN